MTARMIEESRREDRQSTPDPVEVMRELQQLATAHPDLAPALNRAVFLISRQSAFTIDIYRTLIGSRLVEHLT